MPQIPAGWEETTLGKLLDVKHGFAFKWDYISDKDNGNVLLTPWNFAIWGGWKDWKKFYNWEIPISYILKWWEIVITMTDLSKDWDTLGFPAIVPIDDKRIFLHNQRIWLVEFISDNLDLKYCFYKLKTNEYQKYVVNTASWSTVRHTSPDKIKSFIFHRPSLPEQQAIAAVLSSFDDKIELLRAENQTLEQMGQELFKERFGKWKIGDELPEGWRVGKLGKEIKFIKGKKPKAVSDSYKEGRIPQVLIETLDGWISLFADPEKSILLNSGEIVMVMDGASSGRCEIGFSWVLWSTLAKIEVNPSLKLMLYALLKNKFKEINGWTTGSSIPHTDKHKICDFDFIIPTKETLYDFNKLYWNLIEKILLNRKQIQTLSVTRDQLLPKLMSGEVRVEF